VQSIVLPASSIFLEHHGMSAGIYLITIFDPLRTQYVGQAIDFDKRMNLHDSNADSNKSKKIRVDWAIRKHGYICELLEVFHGLDGQELQDVLNKREIHWIEKFNTFLGHGCNCTIGGEGTSGYKQSSEQRRNISEFHKGKKLSPEHCKNLSEAHKNSKRAIEHCRKLSEGNKGRKHSLEHYKKMSKFFKGRKLSLEHRRRIGEANRGKKRSLEQRKKISEMQKGRKPSLEHRKKISEANKGKKRSPEACRKISEGQQKLSKLDKHLVLDIRTKWEAGRSQTFLAREYSMSISSIHNIVRRKTWKHV
jgi:group I intron endonuclease